MNMEKIELAGITFQKVEIHKLPQYIVDDIRECGKMFYHLGECHQNSMVAAEKITNGVESKIVEGLVLCQDGLLFEHFWNRVGDDDFDVTLDVIASETERNMPKEYFEYKTNSLDEMKNRNTFSVDVNNAIIEYYNIHVELKERYNEYRKGRE
jgi:hypothetical protein